jgi:hypothetical protein
LPVSLFTYFSIYDFTLFATPVGGHHRPQPQ